MSAQKKDEQKKEKEIEMHNSFIQRKSNQTNCNAPPYNNQSNIIFVFFSLFLHVLLYFTIDVIKYKQILYNQTIF